MFLSGDANLMGQLLLPQNIPHLLHQHTMKEIG